MLDAYQAAYDESWVKKELSVVRNVLPLVEKYGDLAGTILSGITMWLETLKLKVPFTMKHHPDNMTPYRADIMPKPEYPTPDGVLTFDRLSSVFLSNHTHEEDQPVLLHLTEHRKSVVRGTSVSVLGSPGGPRTFTKNTQ